MKPGLCLLVLVLAGRLSAADTPVPQPQPPALRRTNSPALTNLHGPGGLGSFQVEHGFRLELVAAEPLVINPGAMAFDENGRLFVIENWDGAGGGDGSRGRVRVLEDTDGGGAYNSSAVYAKDLTSPTALVCYGGGAFVACGDEIIYLKDSKGDGTADVRRDVFKGFADATNGANGKLIITSMAWGLDNRIHVATASRSGDVMSSSAPRQSLILGNGTFDFDPRTFVLAAENGSAPSGMSFDDRGRRFVADKTHHIEMLMYDSRHALRNPYYSLPDALVDIATGDDAGRFTEVRSMVIYRGNAFPINYAGNVFVVDGAANLVHRDVLRPNDVGLVAEHALDELGTEFLVCRDQSFQPMQLANAPDGTLYVDGLVRETAVRPGARGINANSDGTKERGRIYRVAPINFKRPKQPKMGKAGVNELVAMLRHPNGWSRDTAARLLYEHRDKAAVAPLILLLYDLNAPPLARMHSLHALDGLSMLVPAHLARALNDPDDRVREHALLLAEKFVTKDGNLPDLLFSQLGGLTSDPSPTVRYQLAYSLGQIANAGRIQLLADLVRSDAGSQWMQSAALSSLSQGGGEMFSLLAADANVHDGDAQGEFLRRLLLIIGAKNQTEEVTQTLSAFAAIGDPQLAFDLAQALDDGLQSANSSLMAADGQGVLRPLYLRAARLALDTSASDPLRGQAIRLLAAISFTDPNLGVILTQQWPYLKASLRNEAVIAMLSWPAQTEALLSGLERGLVSVSSLSSMQRKFLLAHPDANIRQRATYLFGNQGGASRRAAVDRFGPALQMTGTSSRGRELFMARCAGCHKLRSEGNLGGLELAGTADKGWEEVLIRVLDPNREATPNSSGKLVQTSDGRTLIGFITSQTTKSITLCQANGVAKVVGRQNIKSLESLAVSAMPEGLEEGLGLQDMADLLEYLDPASPPR